MKIKETIRLALEYYEAGNLRQAESICREILKHQPHNIQVLHLLGVMYSQVGNYDSAISYIRKALRLNPKYPEAYNNLGNIMKAKGNLNDAIGYFRKAINLNPYYADAFYNLGNAFIDNDQLDDAMTCYQKAIDLNPRFVSAFNNLGNAFMDKGQLDDAIVCFQKAIQLDPNIAVVHNNLGNALKEKGCFSEAIACYQRALRLNPVDAETYCKLGNALKAQGKMNEAIAFYERALDYNPSHTEALWARCMAQLPIMYNDQSSIEIARKCYAGKLNELREMISPKTPKDIEAASKAVGRHQPFYLAYQDLNDRELQKLYGDMVCRIMALKYSQFASPPAIPTCPPGEPLRIGIVSGYFYDHSNWKIPIKGWIENIDKQKFNIYGYYTWNRKDQATVIARRCFNKFVEDIYSLEKLCEIIRDDDLHVLIFPEIGMDPMSIKLASLKLVPIQCTSWGHPDTSGLPSMDYYLSSDLMEPPDGDSHYSEKLIRLPNLSIYYEPLEQPIVSLNRDSFGLRPRSILYLCCQSLYKYLPQYDEVYPRIAQQVGDCQFLFISNRSVFVTEQFRLRLKLAFNKYRLNAEDHIVFLPFLDPAQYCAINRLADIYLDSIGWSGCNSTFEAVFYDLPVVTLPGELMRGRHGFAILSMMNIQDTIASSLDEYVEIAVHLGMDSEWRKQISHNVEMNKHLVYRDRTCIAALEEFLERVIKEKLI